MTTPSSSHAALSLSSVHLLVTRRIPSAVSESSLPEITSFPAALIPIDSSQSITSESNENEGGSGLSGCLVDSDGNSTP